MADFDPGELGGQLRRVAGELDGLSERLQTATDAAHARDYRAADREGLAEVVVDGRPRVVSVTLHADALRDGPDELDRLLTGLLNDALTQARAGTRDAVFEALPAGVRTEVEREVDPR